MNFSFGPDDEALRQEARAWLAGHLAAEPAPVAGRAWERTLGSGGWIGLGWDCAAGTYGNRTAPLTGQVVWAEEYSRARGEEIWCQGYSEPGAGSDLAAVRTAAVRDPGSGTYRITGQKLWTSHAREADWCFLLARTTEGSRRHHGLSLLLVPMDQPGRIDIRPIRQLTGDAGFNEVFFDGAEARAGHVLGGEGNGWRVAMDLLGRERGAATLAQQIGFAAELARVVRLARETGAAEEPAVRDRLVRQWAELRTLRWTALRSLGGTDLPGAPSVAKLLWSTWHQRLGELTLRVQGPAAVLGPRDWSDERPYELDALQRLFLFSRADTIYGGSAEVQRTIIAERILGLPKEPRP
ncbi:acyl-CoA dehydrogenase family protein [Streptomyces sp. URMC 127]|uniref:acyl-CoA dehydrogenase family protein n=1 Tax=Streptomyces sp. URMC 127 TaxID=3423402 RepID=UPI003F19E46C